MSQTLVDKSKTYFVLLVASLLYIKFIGTQFTHPFTWVIVHLAPIPITIAVLRRHFHGLTKFPGPWLWSATRLPMFWYLCKGTLPQKIAELHEIYGPVVRIAPTELSFTCEEAWAPIYNKPVGKPQLRKDPTQFIHPSSGIGGLHHEKDDAAHGQVKRNFSHAFAEKTMLEQERIIQSYITQFINRLRDLNGKPTDICNLFNCLTFDIIGDLAFGQPFGSLEDLTLHPWIQNIFTHVAASIILGMIQKFTYVYAILAFLLRSKMHEAEAKHNAFVSGRLHQRLALDVERPDFITHVQKSLDTPSGITLPQLQEAVNQIIIGGSETSGTVLSATTYLLLTHPAALTKLTSLIRTSFPSASSITMKSINDLSSQGKLDYLHAIISETLRLFPPTPGNMTRMTPSEEGCVIAGMSVPGDTLVGVNLYSAGRSKLNFARPEEFVPERWLGEKGGIEGFEGDRRGSVKHFSMGPRSCIGKNLAYMEMRLILSHILFEFDLFLAPESAKWSEGMKIWAFWSKPPLMVGFLKVERGLDFWVSFRDRRNEERDEERKGEANGNGGKVL